MLKSTVNEQMKECNYANKKRERNIMVKTKNKAENMDKTATEIFQKEKRVKKENIEEIFYIKLKSK